MLSKTTLRFVSVLAGILFFSSLSSALTPDEVLVVYNGVNPESKRIADYYAQKRQIPARNVLVLDLPTPLADSISRVSYDRFVAEPIRQRLSAFNPNENIRCILLTYGIPYKLGKRTPTPTEKQQADRLTEQARKKTKVIYQYMLQLDQLGYSAPKSVTKNKMPTVYKNQSLFKLRSKALKTQKRIGSMSFNDIKQRHFSKYNFIYDQLYGQQKLVENLIRLNMQIDQLTGQETNASVDSELSLVMSHEYNLYRWQPNRLKGVGFNIDFITKMVSRLDGPDPNKIIDQIDKSIRTEKTGLTGVAYFDSRGLKVESKKGSFGYVDNSIRNASAITRTMNIPTVTEDTKKLFPVGQCPNTAIYCGWYSLKKYIPSFTFNDGAVGYHIASWEAIDIRDTNSTQWCPSMLNAGITATLGAVSEPYLQAFPEPDKFFAELLRGSAIVEAYYKTKPYNSWQLILLADPLYRPYKNKAFGQ